LKPVLVTGGTGFLGSHLVDRLVLDGKKVRVFARPGSSTANIREHIENGNVEIVRGDLRNSESLKQACSGVKKIYNTASAVDFSLPEEIFYSVNVHALRDFVNTAVETGVERFIHVSSIGFYGWSQGPIDEKTELRPLNVYEKTKLLGERIVFEDYEGKGFPVTVIEPSAIYGPRARVGIPRMIQWVKKGWMPLIDDGSHRLNMVYVSDVVEALILASEKREAIGEKFVIGYENSPTYREIFETLSDCLGVEPPRWSVPAGLARFFSAIIQKGAELLGLDFFPLYDYLNYMTLDGVLDISKAKRILGYTPKVGLKEGMQKTVEWFCKNNLVCEERISGFPRARSEQVPSPGTG